MYDRLAMTLAADRLAAEDEKRRRHLDREIAREPRTVRVMSPDVCERGHKGQWRAYVTGSYSRRYCAACAHLNDSAARRKRKERKDGR